MYRKKEEKLPKMFTSRMCPDHPCWVTPQVVIRCGVLDAVNHAELYQLQEILVP